LWQQDFLDADERRLALRAAPARRPTTRDGRRRRRGRAPGGFVVMSIALELWRRWFEENGEPWANSEWGMPCFFCWVEHPNHDANCVYVLAAKLLENSKMTVDGDAISIPLEEMPGEPWGVNSTVSREPASLLQTLIYNTRKAVEMGRDSRAGFHWIGPDGSCEVCPVSGIPDLWRVLVSTKAEMP